MSVVYLLHLDKPLRHAKTGARRQIRRRRSPTFSPQESTDHRSRRRRSTAQKMTTQCRQNETTRTPKEKRHVS